MAPELSPHALLVLEARTRQARLRDRCVDLTDAEYALLYLLLEARGACVSKKDLSRALTDAQWTGQGHHVEVHVSRLRAKLNQLEPERPLIATVRGRGYRYVGDVDVPPAVALIDPAGLVRWATANSPIARGSSWEHTAGASAEQVRRALARVAGEPAWTQVAGLPVQLSAVEGMTGVVIAAWGDAVNADGTAPRSSSPRR